MPISHDFTPEILSDSLEEICSKFAYKMLFLEISLSQENENIGNRSVQIAQLTSLYMKAVQTLQGRFQQGFMFFHNKIQNLMKKRSVVEELFKSVNSSLAKNEKTMMAVSRAQIQQRREDYDIRMTFQNEKFDHKKVKEIIKATEMKINMIEGKIKTGILIQEQALANRIKLRKMRSQASINNDEKFKNNQKQIHPENIEEYFAPQIQFRKQEIKLRKKSNQKQRKRKLLLFNSFSSEIKI